MTSECPRSANSNVSVTAGESLYCLSVDFVTASGTVWSSPPMTSSSGPRSGLPVSTLLGEWRWKLALAASKSGWPGAAIAHWSNKEFDSSSLTALPNA